MQVEQLYGDVTLMTYNIHQLLHLAGAAKDLGPLWAHSTFVFETGNGRIVKLIKAAKGAPSQIIERIAMEQQLHAMLLTAPLAEKPAMICHELLGYKRLRSSVHNGDACFLGSGKPVSNFTSEEQEAIAAICGTCPAVATEFFRFTLHGTIHSSLSYRRPERSDSTVCTKDGAYLQISRILRFRTNRGMKCVILCKELIVEDPEVLLPPHIHQCFVSPERRLRPIFVDDIERECLFFFISS